MKEVKIQAEDENRAVYRLQYWDEKERDSVKSFLNVPQHLPRIVRGGFFSGDSEIMRSSYRAGFRARVRSADVGFRIGFSTVNTI